MLANAMEMSPRKEAVLLIRSSICHPGKCGWKSRVLLLTTATFAAPDHPLHWWPICFGAESIDVRGELNVFDVFDSTCTPVTIFVCLHTITCLFQTGWFNTCTVFLLPFVSLTNTYKSHTFCCLWKGKIKLWHNSSSFLCFSKGFSFCWHAVQYSLRKLGKLGKITNLDRVDGEYASRVAFPIKRNQTCLELARTVTCTILLNSGITSFHHPQHLASTFAHLYLHEECCQMKQVMPLRSM